MRKFFEDFIKGLECLCLIGVAIFTLAFFFPRRVGPDYVLSVLSIEIPQYEIISKKEVWSDYYDYTISFSTDYSASIIKQFENRKEKDGVREIICEYDEAECNFYLYCEDDTPGDYHYFASVYPKKGFANLWVSFEFGERWDCLMGVALFFFIGLTLVIIYGITILTLKVSNFISAKRKHST